MARGEGGRKRSLGRAHQEPRRWPNATRRRGARRGPTPRASSRGGGKCSCSSRAAAREAGRQDSSTPSVPSRPRRPPRAKAASPRAPPFRREARGDWEDGGRDARGNCSRRTAAPLIALDLHDDLVASLLESGDGSDRGRCEGQRRACARERALAQSDTKGCSRSSSKKETGGTATGTSARIPEIEAAYARESVTTFAASESSPQHSRRPNVPVRSDGAWRRRLRTRGATLRGRRCGAAVPPRDRERGGASSRTPARSSRGVRGKGADLKISGRRRKRTVVVLACVTEWTGD